MTLPALSAETASLTALLREGNVAVLTGAGVSTASGIPDYRGPETRRRARNPIRFAQFVGDPAWRQRYWARSFIGWRRVASARPNPAHDIIAQLERAGLVNGVITQNVDGLHRQAGSKRVVELHGRLSDVVCLTCGARSSRRWLQQRLAAANPGWSGQAEGHAPDGDADVSDPSIQQFHAVDCEVCGGPLKPDVVFFGESVPRERVATASDWVQSASSLLVVGTSLTVFSGFRFVRQAVRAHKPVIILNRGPTRADALVPARIDGDAIEHLQRALDHLAAHTSGIFS